MQYLLIYWIIIFTFSLIYLVSKEYKQFNQKLKKNAFLIFIISLPFLILAILTNDPISILGMEISTELQWLASLLTFGFGSWKFYLNPLKERVIETEKEIKVEIKYMNKTLEEFKNKLDIIIKKIN